MSSQTLLGFTNAFYKQPSHPVGKYVISQKCYDVYMVSKLLLSGRKIDVSYICNRQTFFDKFVHLADMFL
jgi:hypothetical protein